MKTNYDKFKRTIQIVGLENFLKLQSKKLIVFGVGGVGGQAVESLVRAGFVNITIVDYDKIETSNFNRQLLATESELAKIKVEVAKRRMLEINKEAKITALNKQLTKDNISKFNLHEFDYIIDAIDEYSSKIALITYALRNKLKIISSMGAGNRLDPTKVKISKVENTFACPIAKKIRLDLKKLKLNNLNVVFSEEYALENKYKVPGSSSFVPPAFGLAIASFVFKQLIA
ncbi:MAG TPA: ThiF family adenylyltransferase [Bacilli bacterium]|nr:ThiF family adenylyltransferase [Bacilli bacterium]